MWRFGGKFRSTDAVISNSLMHINGFVHGTVSEIGCKFSFSFLTFLFEKEDHYDLFKFLSLIFHLIVMKRLTFLEIAVLLIDLDGYTHLVSPTLLAAILLSRESCDIG